MPKSITEATRADPMDVVRIEENKKKTAAALAAQGRRKQPRAVYLRSRRRHRMYRCQLTWTWSGMPWSFTRF